MNTDPEVVALLCAAEQIADGLADLARAIYDIDPTWKNALAAANAASAQFQDASRAAQEIEFEGI